MVAFKSLFVSVWWQRKAVLNILNIGQTTDIEVAKNSFAAPQSTARHCLAFMVVFNQNLTCHVYSVLRNGVLIVMNIYLNSDFYECLIRLWQRWHALLQWQATFLNALTTLGGFIRSKQNSKYFPKMLKFENSLERKCIVPYFTK